MSQQHDTQLEHVIPLEGPGVTAESYRMHGRLGRMRPLPSAQRTIFMVDNPGEPVVAPSGLIAAERSAHVAAG